MEVRSSPPVLHSQVFASLQRRRLTLTVTGLVFALAVAGCSSDSASKPTSGTGSELPTASTTPAATLPIAVTTPLAVATTLPAVTVAPTVAASTTGAVVVVANASTVEGAAGRFSEALQAKKFDVAKAVNATIKVEVSKVYYDPSNAAALPVATFLGAMLGGIKVEVMPSPIPVKDAKLPDGVSVVLMLGSDKADKPIDQAATTTVAATVGSVTTLGSATTVAPPP